jgi:hypothetical protein
MTNKYEYLVEFDDLFDSISDAQIRKGASLKLKWMESEYYEKMCNMFKERWENPEYREMMITLRKEMWENPEHREMMSHIRKEMWQDPEYRELICKIRESSEFREKISDIVKERSKDPEYRKNLSIKAKERCKDPELMSKMVESRYKTGMYTDPEKAANFKSPIIGTNIKTGEEIIFYGAKQLRNAGFEPGNVYYCISGSRKKHKGYTWRRKTLEKE